MRHLLVTYAEQVRFFTPDVCIASAQAYLPDLAHRRGWSREGTLELLTHVSHFIEIIDVALYADVETPARARLAGRDEEDWPVVALALTLASPIWTEDRDFFGAGIATWTTDRVELYLRQPS